MKPGLFSYIFVPVMALTAAVLLSFGLISSSSVEEYFFSLSYRELAELAKVSANAIADLAARDPLDPRALDEAIDGLAAGSEARLTFMDPQGNVLADSQGVTSVMQNHGDRPEVIQALKTGQGRARRRSASVNEEQAYVAIGLKDGSRKTIGVMRVSLPLSLISAEHERLNGRLALIGCAAALLAAAFSILLARSLSRSLRRIAEGARSFARGDAEAPPLPVGGPGEFAALASSLNRMAGELDGRMRVIEGQKREVEAILNGMSEAVIVLSADLRVRSCNPAALRLFGQDAEPRDLIGLCANTEIESFAATALASPIATENPMETTLTLYGKEERYLRLSATSMEKGELLLVLNDLTRMTRLERVRQDLVANVSHELKTPVTVVQSALETLSRMGTPEGPDAEAYAKFLGSALRQAERLSAIIEDILSLARIEEEEKAGIETALLPIRPIILSAVESVRRKIDEKAMRFELDCPEEFQAPVNANLLEQAMMNLIDNAAKFSPPGTSIEVRVREAGDFCELRVQDHGRGIPAADRPRLFERFYRVDRARSREAGGTGLGLSIVKHIAKAHGGSVALESEEGRGSAFTIRIPR